MVERFFVFDRLCTPVTAREKVLVMVLVLVLANDLGRRVGSLCLGKEREGDRALLSGYVRNTVTCSRVAVVMEVLSQEWRLKGKVEVQRGGSK